VLGEIVQIGSPTLRQISTTVADYTDPSLVAGRTQLHQTLAAFRKRHGFGRAIAAPQMGDNRRYIALDLGAGPFTVHNPQIAWRSADTFTLWDDCLSFPDLLVRVARHRSISVTYADEQGHACTLEKLTPDLSELLQHEIDHLDGVLAVDHANNGNDLVTRTKFIANRDRYASMVDATPRLVD
jgi:peptide deformylase